MFLRTVAIGLGATLFLDLCNLLLKHGFKMPVANFCLVGRWFCHMPRGVFAHASIAKAAPMPGECAVGWIAHYALGALFALSFVALVSPTWLAAPAPGPALVFGLVTVALPFFVMHPAFGLGIAASMTPQPTQARLRTVQSHALFGLGLYFSALLLRGA
jgi:Protein of unknown function (DUF2938)